MAESDALQVRWLGRVRFADAHALQRSLFEFAEAPYLLLCEHHHVFTMGLRGTPDQLRVPRVDLGADLVRTDRGGAVTYHGPGQLVGYPIVSAPTRPGATADHVWAVEQVVIDACSDLGLVGLERRESAPGVWLDAHGMRPRKVAAVGVRRSRGRTMHGFALNVNPDLDWFQRIVPCGLADAGVTSLAAENIDVSMPEVVEAIAGRAARQWGAGHQVGRFSQDLQVEAQHGDAPGSSTARKPEWLRLTLNAGPGYLKTRSTVKSLGLVTVCEEAGCPNMSECWNDGTATFMINGDRCTRACGFCLVDTRRPMPTDDDEAERVAEAVAQMGLAHAVITAVARDDLPDGGAAAFAACIAAIRARCPATAIEVLIPDCKGDEAALGTIFNARPDVLNHNLETVARLQRRVRPSASYARSLAVLGRARNSGLLTKSGLMVGLGETGPELTAAMLDLRSVGVSILTLGQYLRPSADHLAVSRWWTPAEFASLADEARALGFRHVEASPLARSSYHARQGLAGAL